MLFGLSIMFLCSLEHILCGTEHTMVRAVSRVLVVHARSCQVVQAVQMVEMVQVVRVSHIRQCSGSLVPAMFIFEHAITRRWADL